MIKNGGNFLTLGVSLLIFQFIIYLLQMAEVDEHPQVRKEEEDEPEAAAPAVESARPNYEPPSRNTTLIESLREQPSFLMEQYNQKLKADNEAKGIRRAGGVYIPPHKLRALQEQMLQQDPSSQGHQRMMWELLRKSINGIVNKVNIANIQNIVVELFNENILRGRGLLARALIKAQMASPNFTHVYTALIAVINTKVPEIGLLVAKRVLIQFKRSFERNNKIVCVATTKMIAHLVNQRILGEYIALQILFILLTTPSDDSVEIACDFMIEVGQVLSELTPAGANAIFDRFKSLLHEAQIEQKAQYSIENLFAVRKTGFKEHPGVIAELDLVEIEDQITHQLDVEEEMRGEEQLNIFKFDPKYQQNEDLWERTKMEILGEENIARLKQPDQYEEEYDEEPAEEGIQDLTEQDLINLRKTIYLAIQSTVNFEECAHKILKMNIAKGYQHELVDMILECCMMERIYQSFFGLLAERFCTVDEKFKELFLQAFLNHYNNIFKQEANKIRNLARLFGHLFCRQAVDWKVLQAIRLTPDSTTAAARMFLKIFLKEIAQNMGIDNLAKQFQKEENRQYYEGLFPIDNPNDLRFAINYYTTIGLGKLTEQMREILALQEEIISQRKRKEEEAKNLILMQEEEEMMRMAMEEMNAKQEEQKKIKHEESKLREKERERERERSKERKEREVERTKEREREREKERIREGEREKEREVEREKAKQLERQRAKARETERAREADKAKQRERVRGRSRDRNNDRRDRNRYRSESEEDRRRRREATPKRRRRSSSSSDNKRRSKPTSKKEDERLKKPTQPIKKKQTKQESDSSSSGLQSSSSSSSSESKPKMKVDLKAKPKKKSSSESSSSSVPKPKKVASSDSDSSDSSSSSSKNLNAKKQKRLASNSD